MTVNKNQLFVFLLIALLASSGWFIYVNYQSQTKSLLSCKCPPGFQLTNDNTCIARNLYQQYNSLQNAGGG